MLFTQKVEEGLDNCFLHILTRGTPMAETKNREEKWKEEKRKIQIK